MNLTGTGEPGSARILMSGTAAMKHQAEYFTVRLLLVVVRLLPSSLVSAAGAAGLGAKVALVERHLMGGDCLNVGCVPHCDGRR